MLTTFIYTVFSSSFLLSTYFYFKFERSNQIQNARILSLNNAFFTSIVGLYKFFYYYKENGITNYSCSGTALDDFFAVFFTVFLSLDLIVGTLEYPQSMGFLTGYVHHSSFILIMSYIYYIDYTACSSLIYIFEVPTFFLCAKYLFPKYKVILDLIFGILFLLIRILLHAQIILELMVDYFYYGNLDKYYFIPIMCGMLSLHIYWFRLYLRKF